MNARFALAVVAGLLAIPLAWLQAEEKTAPAKAPLPAGLVAPQTKATAAAGICFLEGPAVDAQGTVFFSDIANFTTRCETYTPAEVVAQVNTLFEIMTRIITGAMHEGPPSPRDLAVARTLQQVWLSALIGWVGGVDDALRVVADLEAATQLLLGEA